MEGAAGAHLWQFAARADELARVETFVVDGGAGAVLIGDPGVGKSRLLAELARRAEDRGARVVRAAGTRSLAGVPFGALAGVLVPAEGAAGQRFDVLQAALTELRGDGSTPTIIVVDDAHLLDETSAGLLALAAQTGCVVLATIRREALCPDEVTRLWKDDLALRIDLEPLDRTGVGEVLEAALGGSVESRTRHHFWEVTRGNLLFLRELVRHALARESLVQLDGVWTWTGAAVDAPAVRDLVLGRVRELDPEVRALVDVLAVGEPLGLVVAQRLSTPGALDAAEREAVVAIEFFGARREVRLVHPLYADVLRDELGVEQRAEHSAAVAEALRATGARRSDDVLRVALLQLDAGIVGEPAEMLAAGQRALGLADLALTERIARAVIGATGDIEAVLLLSEPLYWGNRYTELVELLGTGVLDNAPPAAAGRGAMNVASAVFFGMGDLDEAAQWLEWGIEHTDPVTAAELRGQHAQMLMFAGRATESMEIGRAVIADPLADPNARLRAYSGWLPSAASCGRLAEVDAALPDAFGLIAGLGPNQPFAAGGVMVASFITRLFGGGLAELDTVIAMLHDDAVRRKDDVFAGVWSFLLGRSTLAQGRLADSVQHLRDSAAALRVHDPGSVLPWALAALAQALGQIDDGRGATAVVTELDTVLMPTIRNIEVDVELGHAWAAAARGERSHAVGIAATVGEKLIAEEKHAIGALALHDALRLGAAPARVVEQLAAAAAAVDGPVIPAMAAHARAVVDADFDGLLAAADAFEALGMMLLASEAAAEASRAASTDGLRSRQREAAARSAQLAAHCGPALTPVLETFVGKHALASLTRREQEIALMAGRGSSKREIAGLLFLSERTVGNHINHIYAKLGISSRDELRVALGVSDSAPATAASSPTN